MSCCEDFRRGQHQASVLEVQGRFMTEDSRCPIQRSAAFDPVSIQRSSASKWRKAIYASLGAKVGFSSNHPKSGHAASGPIAVRQRCASIIPRLAFKFVPQLTQACLQSRECWIPASCPLPAPLFELFSCRITGVSKAQRFRGFQRKPVCWPSREIGKIALRRAHILRTYVLCHLAQRFSI